MLMTAQPLHAYDLDKVPGGELIVRTARPGEKMTTLDGVERELDAETVLVCDRDQPTGIAALMGGQVSEVSESTTTVLLEVANWNGTNVLETSRRLSLRSEASARFEKQLHPDLCMRAQAVASRLIGELCGANLEGTVPPPRYYDVTREIDLIEEGGRLHGFTENLPTTLPRVGAGKVGRLNRTQRLRRRAEDELRDLGFDQIVGWSFTDPGEASRLRIEEPDPRADPILVANPLSDEGAAMRTTLLGSLLDVAARNLARGREAGALFEAAAGHLA